MTYSSTPSTSSDHASKSRISFSFESWIEILSRDSLSLQDQAFFMQGLQDHPEWLNQRGQFLQTPLIIASEYGHIEIVQALIQAGADLHLRDDEGWTALMHASYACYPEVIKLLIQQGAHLNLQDDLGRTALMKASHRGRIEAVKTLINFGADLNLQDQKGFTALMHAASLGHETIVKSLIHQGVNPLILNQSQKTAFDLARQYGYQTLSCLLEAYMDSHVSSHALTQVIHPLDSSSSCCRPDEILPLSLKPPRL